MAGIISDNFEKIEVNSTEELHDWLEAHHTQEKGVWLVTYKKSTPGKYISTGEVLDELLCYGWMDGIRRKLDEYRTMQLISPRRVQHWSKTYKDRAARLIQEGRMKVSGHASIESAKASGLWDFLNDVDALIKPDDLIEEFAQYPGSSSNFDNFGAASQRFVLRWIKLAKTDATRQKRISQTAMLAAQNKKVPGS